MGLTQFPRFVFAAEIIRDTYNGWNQADQDQFTNFLLNVVYGRAQAVCHSCPEATTGQNVGLSNWATLGTMLRMSIAVYTDNQAYFYAAVADYQHLIEASFDPSGRFMETCRGPGDNGLNYEGGGDMPHTNLGMMGLVATGLSSYLCN